MAHIPQVGRRSPKMRLLLVAIYVVLTLGGVTTLYPFMIMLGSSVTSDFDADQYPIVPRYLVSLSDLYGKFVYDKYNGDMQQIDGLYRHTYAKPTDIAPPKVVDRDQVTRWDLFMRRLPQEYKEVGFQGTPGQYAPAPMLDQYRAWLQKKFHNNINALDRAYQEEATTFLGVFPPFERPQMRMYVPGTSEKQVDWASFKQGLPSIYLAPVAFDAVYAAYLRDEVYNNRIGDLNNSWGTSFSSFDQIDLAENAPSQPREAADWSTFVQTRLPLRFLAYRAPRDVALEQLAIHNTLPLGTALTKLSDTVRNAHPKDLTVLTVDTLWRSENGSMAIAPPINQADWAYIQNHAAEIRWGFFTRNYQFTLNYLLLHGNGIWNTVIYCGSAVLIALLVNPLCAYALSRFKLPFGQSVLLFVLATMAFPAEVSMIPNFLLLKQLNLLNTFWALVLPGAASGYSIFLLKGFFDSLPRELYEAGMIDGASELTLFRRVTLPLSKPIFAVIALGAFSAAYGNFLFAMILCQAQSHWTIMVWVYEFEALGAPHYIMMAALVLASLPMLVVFLVAQGAIMRGVILPSFK